MNHLSVCLPLFAVAAVAATNSHCEAATISIEGGSGWTQQEAGFFTMANNGLNAEAGQMWGVSNGSQNRQGVIHQPYSSVISGSSLPSTIQPGTYVLESRIGTNGLGGNNWIGLANQTGSNTSFGAVAGFFATVEGSATETKQNMFTEFIDIPGVTYTTAAPDPADDALASWTFTWEISPGSSVVGSDPNLGFYVKTGNGGGNGFWDDSELSFTPIPEPLSLTLLGTICLASPRRYRKD